MDIPSAEGWMEKSNDRMQYLLKTGPAVIYSAKVQQGPVTNFSLDYVSPNIQTMLGISPEEIYNDKTLWPERFHPQDISNLLVEFPNLFVCIFRNKYMDIQVENTCLEHIQHIISTRFDVRIQQYHFW